LTLHHESREMKAYVLVIDKGGPKLHETSGAPAKSMSGTNQRGSNGTATMTGSGVGMPALAYRIAQQPAFRGGMVLDKTGLNGYYDFTLQWEAGENAGSSLITALREQLGLKLSSEKTSVDVLVIDRAEKPAEN
ncbi:TIGR03435 family protein, partial [Terriglobus sp. YAF25]